MRYVQWAVLPAILLLTACSIRQTPNLIPPGPAIFQEGYADGCDSGTHEAGDPWVSYQRKWEAYKTSADYKQGWDEGHHACFQSYLAMGH